MGKKKTATKKNAPGVRDHLYERDTWKLIESFDDADKARAAAIEWESKIAAGVVLATGTAGAPFQVDGITALHGLGFAVEEFMDREVGKVTIHRTDGLYMLISSGNWSKGNLKGTCGTTGVSLVVYLDGRESYEVTLKDMIEEIVRRRTV